MSRIETMQIFIFSLFPNQCGALNVHKCHDELYIKQLCSSIYIIHRGSPNVILHQWRHESHNAVIVSDDTHMIPVTNDADTYDTFHGPIWLHCHGLYIREMTRLHCKSMCNRYLSLCWGLWIMCYLSPYHQIPINLCNIVNLIFFSLWSAL